MPKRILTQEDFNSNPILPELGLKVGDEVEIPETTEDNENFEPGDGDDTGGSAPPPNKPRP